MRKNEELESDDMVNFCDFVSKRITELRLIKNVSEYQMSLDLGQNRTYIQNISSKRSMPSLYALFKICNYFNITPLEFFDTTLEEPKIYAEAKNQINKLPPEDVELLIPILKRLSQKTNDK